MTFLQALMGTTSKVVTDLGTLHRATIWENISLKSGLSDKGIDFSHTPNTSPLETSPARSSVPLPEMSTSNVANGVQPELPPAETLILRGNSDSDSPRVRNARALRHLTHGIPSALTPFFQGMGYILPFGLF
jgi:E3 ubiquitin-protein ligase HUWE1